MINGVVWALSALSIIMIAVLVYFAIFWMILYVIAWGIIQFLRPIFKILSYGND